MYNPNQGPYGQTASRSPPPLQHPVPTHPPFRVPDPPITPGPSGTASSSTGSAGRPSVDADPHMTSARPRGAAAAAAAPSGYVRYSSPPIQSSPYGQPQSHQQQQQSQQSQHHQSSYNSYAPSPHQNGAQQHQQQQQGGFGSSFPNFANFASLASMAAGAASQGGGGAGQQGGPQGQRGMQNDAMAQMGVQFGTQMARAGQEYVGRNFGSILPLPVLKHYFNVSNSYVLHKLRLVLFPWRHKPWSRAQVHGGGGAGYGAGPGVSSPGGGGPNSPYGAYGDAAKVQHPGAGVQGTTEGFAPPREDVNSPDLYIPSMAFVTYVLLVSVIRGLESRFHPEVLGRTSSRALGIIFFEFVLVKLGCYLLNIQGEHTVIDLLAYGGYKFLGAIITLSVGVLHFGRTAYWATFLYTTAANAFFLLRSLRYVVLPDPSSASSHTITHVQRSRRIQFLFSIALAQTLFGWLLILGIW